MLRKEKWRKYLAKNVNMANVSESKSKSQAKPKSQAELDKEAISQANAAIGEPTGGDVGTLGGANPNVQGKSKIVKKSRVGLLSMQSSDILG